MNSMITSFAAAFITLSVLAISAPCSAQTQVNVQQPACANQRTPTADCKPIKRTPIQRTEFSAPPTNRKPPKPPKQNLAPKDELPERREDNF